MNNYAKSAPEAVLHYYICKYVDKNATLNFIQLTEDGITYTADITCTFQDRLYDIEFDSLSYHSSEIEIEKDKLRDIIFTKNGYTIIRMRNRTKTRVLPDLPNIINISMALNTIGSTGSFPKWQIDVSNNAIKTMLTYIIGKNTANISIERDYNYILDHYFPNSNLKRIEKKYKNLIPLKAHIYIIQECENPELYMKEFEDFSLNFLWIGDSTSKGLGIFANHEITLEKKEWTTGALRNFLPFRANGIDFVAIWAKKPYIEEYYIWQSINYDKFTSETIIVGDFNSNAIWNYKHGNRNHSAVVKQLEEKGLKSIYHEYYKELQGNESINTFYQHRHLDKGYHIDYLFCNPEIISSFEIGDMIWLESSDHLPLIFTINS